MRDWAAVRGFLVGLLLLPAIVLAVLSLRPGGLRAQLRNVARRLRLALILAGVYLVVSTALRLAVPPSPAAEFATAGIAVVLAAIFIVLGQDRQLER
jgi:hypothetical protein